MTFEYGLFDDFSHHAEVIEKFHGNTKPRAGKIAARAAAILSIILRRATLRPPDGAGIYAAANTWRTMLWGSRILKRGSAPSQRGDHGASCACRPCSYSDASGSSATRLCRALARARSAAVVGHCAKVSSDRASRRTQVQGRVGCIRRWNYFEQCLLRRSASRRGSVGMSRKTD